MKFNILTLLFIIPIVHVLANVTTGYYDAGTINPGFIRMVYVLLVIVIFFLTHKIQNRKIALTIFFFLFFQLFLVFLNESFRQPLIVYVRMALPWFMIILGYSLINDWKKLEKLFKIYAVVLGVYCLNFIFSNVFNLGGSAYLEDSFYTGGTSVGIANEMAVLLLCGVVYSMITKSKKWRNITVITVVFSAIFILLMLRRGAWLTLGAGLLVILYNLKYKYNTYRYIVIIGLAVLVTYPFYGDTFIARYEQRAESRGGSIANIEVEGRYLEVGWVIEDIKKHGVIRAFFGTHNLNSVRYFGRRELHVGYMAILHGSGLIGLFLFLQIIYRLFKKETALYQIIRNSQPALYLHVLFISLLFALFAYLLTSRLHGFSTTTPLFLMIGAIIGVIKNGTKEACS